MSFDASPPAPHPALSPRRRGFKRAACSAVVAGPDGIRVLAHRKARDRLVGRRPCHRAGAQVEAGAMAQALDFETEYLAAGEIAAVVGTDVLDRVQRAVDVVDRDRRIAVEHHAELTRQQFTCRAYAHPTLRGQAHAATPASAFTRSSKRRSSRRGTPKRSWP